VHGVKAGIMGMSVVVAAVHFVVLKAAPRARYQGIV
jgi:hypothetical protein